MSAGSCKGFAPLTRGEASFSERGVGFSENQNPPLASGSRPPCQGVKSKKQGGFTYLGILIVVAIMGAGMAAYGQIASHEAQRQKEAELLFRGEQYRLAIESYYKKEQRYPQTLAALVEDKRYPMPVRHLRRLYTDPMTGKADWGIVEMPDGGGVMGVYSKAQGQPIKTGSFSLANQSFEKARTYSDWKFVHSPSGLPRAVEKSSAKSQHP